MAKKHIHIHVGTRDAGSELDTFLEAVKAANSLLTDASRKVASLGSLQDAGLKKQAKELEALIDKARAFAFKIR